MNVEQLHLVLPDPSRHPSGTDLTVHHWSAVLEQFAQQGGREVLLGGAEPLAYPGFWVLVRRGVKVGLPRVTAFLSGSLLEPWVLRGLVESGVHVLIALDSLQAEPHDALHGAGSHARAMAAVESFLKHNLAQRVGILATATRTNRNDLPVLAAWAAGRGLARFLWTPVPDGGWPSPGLSALRLLPEEKSELVARMQTVGRGVSGTTYVGPMDTLDDPALCAGFSPLLRVTASGDAYWGFAGEGGFFGNLRRTPMHDLLKQGAQAAGD